jgi:hypothetical protein
VEGVVTNKVELLCRITKGFFCDVLKIISTLVLIDITLVSCCKESDRLQ